MGNQHIVNTTNFYYNNGSLVDDGMHDVLEDIFPCVCKDEQEYGIDFNSMSSQEETEKFNKLLNQAQC